MSDQNKAVVRRIVEDYWNKKNPGLTGELFATDCSLHTPDGDLQGVKGAAQWHKGGGKLLGTSFKLSTLLP